MAWLLLVPLVYLWRQVASLERQVRELQQQARFLEEVTEQSFALLVQREAASPAVPDNAVSPAAPDKAASPIAPPGEALLSVVPGPPPSVLPVMAGASSDNRKESVAAFEASGAPSLAPSITPRSDTQKPAPDSTPKPPLNSRDNAFDAALFAARNWLFGDNTMVRGGLALVFFGLAWLLRYTADRFSPPIELRYLGVAAFSLALMAFGWKLRSKKRGIALLLQGGGIATLYLASFAAMKLHHLLPGGLAFLLTILLTVVAVALAVLQDAMGLAIAASLGGFVAPILLRSGSGNHVMLFAYFALLNAGIAGVAWFKAWRALNLIGFFSTFGIAFAWGLRAYTADKFATTEPFLILFFLMFVCIGLLFARRKLLAQDGEKRVLSPWSEVDTDCLDGTLAFGPPFIGFGLQYALVRPIEYGMAYSAFALGSFYGLLALCTRRRAALRIMTETYSALAVVFWTLTIPFAFDFDPRWVSASWALEGAGVYWVGLVQRRPLARMFALALSVAASLIYLSKIRLGAQTLLDASVPGTVLLSGAWLFCCFARRGRPERLADWERAALSAASVAGLGFLYLAAPLLFYREGTMIAWALAGAATLFAAVRFSSDAFVVCGVVVQFLAGLLFWPYFSPGASATLVSCVMALAAILGAWRLSPSKNRQGAGAALKSCCSNLLLIAGILWWIWSILDRIVFYQGKIDSYWLLLSLSASGALWTAVARRAAWNALALACLLPMAAAWAALLTKGVPLRLFTGVCWLAFFGNMLLTLRTLARLLAAKAQSGAHILCAWLGILVPTLLAANVADLPLFGARIDSLDWLAWAFAPTLYLWLMARGGYRFWPLDVFAREYCFYAACPATGGAAIWFWMANASSDGAFPSLPYVPFFNPLELGLLFALLACGRWCLNQWPGAGVSLKKTKSILAPIGTASLLALATLMVCRAAHHWLPLPFYASALVGSMWVQAAWSLVWMLFALTLMLVGSQRQSRPSWMAGAALAGGVVLKLFLVELNDSGHLARIVSFIGVGVLLLIVGYFSPLPPKADADPALEK